MAFGQGASFNDPQSDDTTSAPPIPPNPVQQVLGSRKKQKNPRNPTDLARAISMSKRAKQSGHKYG